MTVDPEPPPGAASEPSMLLLDRVDEHGRTTVSLLGSLAARLATLITMSGSDAIGSITAGYAALGRTAALTADGARLRDAIERSRAGENGTAIWRHLQIDRWASSSPPTDVMLQFVNDVALLAASDLDEALALPLAPAEPYGSDEAPRPAPADFADYLLGMWLFGRSVASAIESLVDDSLANSPTVVPPGADVRAGSPSTGRLLR